MKPSIWSKKNRGVTSRQAKDEAQYGQDTSKETNEANQTRLRLEEKARIYDKLRCVPTNPHSPEQGKWRIP